MNVVQRVLPQELGRVKSTPLRISQPSAPPNMGAEKAGAVHDAREFEGHAQLPRPEASVHGRTRCSGGGPAKAGPSEGGNVLLMGIWVRCLPLQTKAPGQDGHGVGGELRTAATGERMKQTILPRLKTAGPDTSSSD
jgi:hypothetical protein